MITRKELHPDLVAELEHLKKLHDHKYARQCVIDELEKEYNSIIRTDIWYEAAKEYLNKNININKLNSLITEFRIKHDIWEDNYIRLSGVHDYSANWMVTSSVNNLSLDIDFNIRDGVNGEEEISIKDLHNAYPNVELEDSFKQFCIEYKRSHEK